MREVVVTGIGLVAGGHASPEGLFDCIGRGESLVRAHPFHTQCGFPNPASAFVDDLVWKIVDRARPEGAPAAGSAAALACYAASSAWARSGMPQLSEGTRAGAFVACNKHLMAAKDFAGLASHYDPTTDRLHLDRYVAAGGLDAGHYLRRVQDSPALAVARLFGLNEVQMTHGDSCAAGGMAIGNAYRYIRHGILDVALAGGVELLCNFTALLIFSAIGALAQQGPLAGAAVSRPFDKRRYGFVMGEGSAFLLLESRAHAQARGAAALARIGGYAGLAEACRMTASQENGSEYARCMESALADAGLPSAAVDHINAHGTSTVANDACEAAAIRKVFGARAGTIPLTANKSAMGHSLANSGAAEAVLSVLSLQRQLVLPTLNFSEADDDCSGLDIVTRLRPAPVSTVLSNSFGFGGENCSLILQSART